MIMARPQFRLVLLTLAVALALVGVTGTAASERKSARGTFTYTSTIFNSTRIVGGDTIFNITAGVTYTGTFNGTSILHGTLIIHPDGSATFHDIETFTGMVKGKSGTITLNLNGTGSVVPPPGSFQGTDGIVSGTGDLANLHGVLHEVGTVPMPAIGPLGTYIGKIHFGDDN